MLFSKPLTWFCTKSGFERDWSVVVVVKFVVVSRVQFCLLREKTEKRLGVGSLAERGIRSKSRH